MNFRHSSRSPSRFSPINEHPSEFSPEHTFDFPLNYKSVSQNDKDLDKFDSYRTIGTNSSSMYFQSPELEIQTGEENKEKDVSNKPIVIPIIQEKSNLGPKLSNEKPKNGGNSDDQKPQKFDDKNSDEQKFEKHDVQIHYHSERQDYPVNPRPPYYEDYGYEAQMRPNYFSQQYTNQGYLDPYSQYYGFPNSQNDQKLMSPISPKIAENGKVKNGATKNSSKPKNGNHKNGTLNQSHRKVMTKEKKYHRVHCCCLSFIWPPFAYEECEPPKPMYPKPPKTPQTKPRQLQSPESSFM